MATSDNILQQVKTYQMSNLAFLLNLSAFIGTANTRFKDFDRLTANLGDTVTFDLPPRFVTTPSLVASFQPAEQRVQPLTVDKEISTSYAFTDQQFIFNARDYMERFGKAAIYEIGSKIESHVAQNCVTNTYRFYGDGVTPINSYNQLAQAIALYTNYGAARGGMKGYLSDVAEPAIVGSGLNQFAPSRNDRIANSWEVGRFAGCEWYKSNLLPVHVAGTTGNTGATLTVKSFTPNADGSITQITFTTSGDANDANAVKKYDKFEFQDGVGSLPNLRYLTFIGHLPSNNPVQFQATEDAGSDGSKDIVVKIYPPLQSTATNSQNLNTALQVGMKAKVLPSHRAGLITAGDPLYLAMPQLPNETPYPTGNSVDPDTGVSIRQYYGSMFAQNMRGMVHDAIYGSTLVPEYSMALIFPL